MPSFLCCYQMRWVSQEKSESVTPWLGTPALKAAMGEKCISLAFEP